MFSRSLRILFINKYIKEFYATMSSTGTYEEAVHKLNSLQSNKATLEEMKKERDKGIKSSHLLDMENYLKRCGLSLNRLDELSVIHIAGTKGKGTTSAMCESMLRNYGFKTGFYSSPHLVVVRERIRINGEIISEEKFTQHFFHLYAKLQSTKTFSQDMPKYFHFLTVMAFHTFLEEKVDVVILEVGVGGKDDSTNVVRQPKVVGITSLGLDHIHVLGNTIEEIARSKAGIMKRGCEAYTVSQVPNAMSVLKEIAEEKNCNLKIIPRYDTYTFANGLDFKLPINNVAYKSNASLAIQLTYAWLRKANHIQTKDKLIENKNTNFIYEITERMMTGLSNCFWPGRYQRMDVGFAELFLDGAHTAESMDICKQWFTENAKTTDNILVFSATGDRDFEELLLSLKSVKFNEINFVVPVAYKGLNSTSDTYSAKYDEMVSKLNTFANQCIKKFSYSCKVLVHQCIWDAFAHINRTYELREMKPSILVTGSLYLVGGTLAIFDPHK